MVPSRATVVNTMIEIDAKPQERGFSLTELIMLLLISAILLAISVPLLGSAMHSMQLISDARNIATTMGYAKLAAASQMTRYKLAFDSTNNEWRLLRRNSSGTYVLQNDVNQLSSGMRNSGIAFKSTSPTGTAPSGFPTTSSAAVTIDSRGIPREGASIVYISDNARNYAVSMSVGGKVQVWRYRDSQWVAQ